MNIRSSTVLIIGATIEFCVAWFMPSYELLIACLATAFLTAWVASISASHQD